jgi:type IV fimbrial biogenesis protein FimT
MIVERQMATQGCLWDGRRPGRRDAGFTLIELVVTITIVGILAAIAAPAFSDFVVQQRIRNAAFELMSDLTFARSEAVKRNAAVTVNRLGTWAGGWTVDSGGTTIRAHPAFPNSLSITAGSNSVAFALNGRASPAMAFTIDDAGGKTTIPAQCVSLDASGRPRAATGSCS